MRPMSDRDREAVYDAEIYPLMNQIIAICQRENIPIVASFDISSPAKPGLKCTTSILPPDSSKDLVAAAQILADGFVAFAVRLVKRAPGGMSS